MSRHADQLDHASDLEQRERDAGIARARLKTGVPKVYHTHCQWCGDPTEAGAEFCSYGMDSCFTDADRRRRTRRAQGMRDE